MRQTTALAVVGTVVGLWAAYAASRTLTAVLYGVAPHDLLTFILVPGVLALVAGLACIAPARRAARVDPLIALRYE